MGLNQVTRRTVPVAQLVNDQFSAYGPDGYTKVPGLVLGVGLAYILYKDGVVQATPSVTVTEIGAPSGEYLVQFTPPMTGFWEIELLYAAQTEAYKFGYDVVLGQAALPGQNFYDRVTDGLGAGVPYATVQVYAAGTSTLLYTTQTDLNGNYAIALTGPLANPQLVDIQYSGSGLQTFKKTSLRLV